MTNEQLQRCSPLLAIKEMQIKISVRYPFTPTRLAGIKDIKASVGEGAEKLKHTHRWWETVWEFFIRLNIGLQLHLTIPS